MPVRAGTGRAFVHIRVCRDAYTYTRLYSARKWRAGTYVYVRRYVRIYGQSSGTDGRTDEQRDRRTDGRQICNALTPVLNEMRCGGRETASGRPVGREGASRGVVPAVVGCGGWSAVGANSHLTNPIINN